MGTSQASNLAGSSNMGSIYSGFAFHFSGHYFIDFLHTRHSAETLNSATTTTPAMPIHSFKVSLT